jgi:hypothetical protein
MNSGGARELGPRGQELVIGGFLHRSDLPAPDSLAIPMVQVGDALVIACKPLLKRTGTSETTFPITAFYQALAISLVM